MELWHRRFCHINYGDLEKLAKGNYVRGFELVEPDKVRCNNCAMGKSTKASHSSINSQ